MIQDQKDYFAFIASIGSNRDNCSDDSSNFDDNVSIIENWCKEYQIS